LFSVLLFTLKREKSFFANICGKKRDFFFENTVHPRYSRGLSYKNIPQNNKIADIEEPLFGILIFLLPSREVNSREKYSQ